MKINKMIAGTVSTVALMAVAASAAMAQTFGYSAVFTPNPINSSPIGNYITITNGANALIDAGGSGSAINLSNFVETSNVAPPSTVTISQAFNIALTIQPTGSLLTQTKSFTGTISGEYNTTKSMTATLFNLPTSQTFDFGTLGAYTVGSLLFLQPGPQGSTTVGSIGGIATFRPGPSTVPEPASVIPFALGGLGLLGLIVRKTRRTSGAAA